MTAYLLEAALLFVPAAFGSLGLAWVIVELYWWITHRDTKF